MMWQRLDNPGHEWAHIYEAGPTHILRGTSVFREDRIPGRLDYKIACSSRWETLSADILGWVGEKKVRLRSDTGFATELKVNAEGFVVDYPPLWTEEKG